MAYLMEYQHKANITPMLQHYYLDNAGRCKVAIVLFLLDRTDLLLGEYKHAS